MRLPVAAKMAFTVARLYRPEARPAKIQLSSSRNRYAFHLNTRA
jgi:hypothetical protein